MTPKKRITVKDFVHAVGCLPIHDDLERCNCKQAGEIGHWFCGWCEKHDKPRAVCGCMSIVSEGIGE